MTVADQIDEMASTADRLYAARLALSKTGRSPRRLGVADILQFLSDPRRALSMEEQRSLFADPQLRADYRRLKSQASVVELPALAAASSGVNSRRFEGGTVSIHPSRVAGQAYATLRFASPAGPPRAMLLENSSGDLMKRALPPADRRGEVMIVLDEKNASDQGFLRLISDPTTTGSFLL
jgi:hypothetical protein